MLEYVSSFPKEGMTSAVCSHGSLKTFLKSQKLVGGWTNPSQKYAQVKLDHFPRKNMEKSQTCYVRNPPLRKQPNPMRSSGRLLVPGHSGQVGPSHTVRSRLPCSMRTVNGELWIFEQQEHQAKLSHLSNSSWRWKSLNLDFMYVWDSKQPVLNGCLVTQPFPMWRFGKIMKNPIVQLKEPFLDGWDSRWWFIHRCIPYTSKKSSPLLMVRVLANLLLHPYPHHRS